MTDLVSQGHFSELDRALTFAEKLSKSGIVPRHLVGKPHDILVTILMGRDLGLSEVQSMRSISVINGTPVVGPEAMLAAIRRRAAGEFRLEILESSKTRCEIKMFRGQEVAHTVWDLDRAKHLTGKDNWRNYPTQMLRWRAISECAKLLYSDIVLGIYTPDEFDDEIKTELKISEKVNESKGRVAELVHETQNKFAAPEEVISFSTPAQYNTEDDPEIIALIENRDYVIPDGSLKGKRLCEVPMSQLEKIFDRLNEVFAGKKLNDVQKSFISNMSAYVLRYKGLTMDTAVEKTPQKEPETMPISSEVLEEKPERSARSAKFTI